MKNVYCTAITVTPDGLKESFVITFSEYEDILSFVNYNATKEDKLSEIRVMASKADATAHANALNLAFRNDGVHAPTVRSANRTRL